MGRTLKILAIVVVVLGAALAVVLFTDFEAPKLGRRLVRIAGEAAGIELEAENVRLSLRKGLLLEGVVARARADGEHLTASLDLLEVECELIPLIRGEVVVQRILLQAPTIEVISSDPASGRSIESDSAPAEPTVGKAPSEDAEVSLAGRPKPISVGELSIVDARFTSRSQQPGGPVTEIDDLDLHLFDFELDAQAQSAVVGVTGRGRMSAAGVRLGDRELNDLIGELTAEDGRYLLSNVGVAGHSGRIRVERLEIDLRQDPYRYRVGATMRDVDLGTLLEGALGTRLGRASMDLDATGEGPGLVGAVADVVVRLDAGSLPSVPALWQIDRLLGTSIDGTSYGATEIQLSVVGAQLEIEAFELATELVRLGVAGTADLGAEVALNVSVGLPRAAFSRDDFSEEVLDFLTDREDWLTIPLAITGTLDHPRFAPDLEAVKSATRQLLGGAKDAAQRRIRSELEGAIRHRLGA